MRSLISEARARPAFGLYLAALATLPFKWFSPLGELSERGGWTDVFVALAVAAWGWERARARSWQVPAALRLPYAALAAYVLWCALSAAFASGDRGTAATNMLLIVELAMLTVLTADFAASRTRLRAVAQVVLGGAVLTCLLSAVGLLLFYAGSETSLIGPYGEQLIASDAYARVAAGFYSPPLLGSYCIFAAAVLAIDSEVSPRARAFTRTVLGAVAVATLSRAALGFFVAAAMRLGAARESRPLRLAVALVAVCATAAIVALTVGRLEVDPTRLSTFTYEVPDPGNRRVGITSSFETLKDNPLFGTGPGTLPGIGSFGQPFRAHLTPLNVAATVGLPALAALTMFIALLWRHRQRPTEIAIWSGLAGLAVDALAQDVEHFRHVWILLGLAAATTSGRSGPEGG